MIKTGERIDELLWRKLKIIQNPQGFCFSIDAVLLAHFVSLRPGDQVVDLGAGTGVIPLLLTARVKGIQVRGLELMGEVAEMARRSVEMNRLEEHIRIENGDLKEASLFLGKGKYDLVVSNPPYAKQGSGKISSSSIKSIARTEIMCNLDDVIREAAALLNSEGRFCLVHRPARLADIIYLMRKNKIEPKRLRLVHPMLGREPNIVLLEGIKGGKNDMVVYPPLFVYQDKEVYSEEMKRIFSGAELPEEW